MADGSRDGMTFLTIKRRLLQGAIEDDFWVVKNKHGPYGKRDLKFLKYFGTRIPENFCDHNPSKCLNKKKKKNGRGLL